MGRRPADLVIRNGRLVNVHTREVLDGMEVAVAEGRVAMFGDVRAHGRRGDRDDRRRGRVPRPGPDRHPPARRVGDGHGHALRRGRAASRDDHGFIDNHEMANVFGLEGMRWFLEEGRGLPLKVFLAVPSCVPALPGFEDAGAALGPAEIREALGWEGVAGLGEMMNMPGVIAGDENVHAEIAATLERGMPVTGHWSLAGQRRPPPPGLHRGRGRLVPRDDHARGRARQAARRDVGAVPRRLDVPRRRGARAGADRGRRRLAPLPARHRRRSPRHGRRRRAHGPGRPPGDRGGDRSARRDPDGDGERGRVLRHAARPRLDRSGPARGHPLRRGPPRLPAAPGARRRSRAPGELPGYEYPPRGLRVDPAGTAVDRGRPEDRGLRRARSRACDRRRLGKRDHRARDHRGAGCRRRGTGVCGARPRESGEHRAARRPRHDRPRLRHTGSASNGARSGARSRTTTTTCSSPG